MTNTALDVNRLTTGVMLNPEQSNEIWTESVKQSALTQLATRVNLPGKASNGRRSTPRTLRNG